jgi:hypothetical protein
MKDESVLGKIKLEVTGKIIQFCAIAPKTYNIVYVHEKTKEILCRTRCKGIPHIGEDYPAFTVSKHLSKHELEHESDESSEEEEVIDIKMRKFKIEDLARKTTFYSTRLTADHFEGIYKKTHNITCFFGSMDRKLNVAIAEETNIRPAIKHRSMQQTPWWEKGKRMLKEIEGEIIGFPPGHKILQK